MYGKSRRLGVSLLLIFLLVACSSDHRPAPVRSLRVGDTYRQFDYGAFKGKTYTVEEGQTLYAIAWLTGKDFRELARINNISPPYTIFPGEKLSLIPKPTSRKRENVTTKTSKNKLSKPKFHEKKLIHNKKSKSQHKVSSNKAKTAHKEAVYQPSSSKHKAAATSHSQKRVTANKAVTKSVDLHSQKGYVQKATTAKSSPAKASLPKKVRQWVWPSDGKITSRFSLQRQGYKGIDFAGSYGQRVNAAAAGKVVYAGSGLRGYGKLVIIKHSEDFLSAYAHNSRILVTEGEWIQLGQKIAEMGSTGTDRTKLHFEIRYRGQPVDPLKYLPAR